MSLEQAKELVRQNGAATWTFEVADDGTVVVGGCDYRLSVAQARKQGYGGPVVRVYET